MAQILPPPPPQTDSSLSKWLYTLWQRVLEALTEVPTGNHPDLANLNSTNYTHVTATEYSALVYTGDSRLSDARTPLSHTHGNITNAGAIGSTAGLEVVTTTSGVLTTRALGTANYVSGVDAAGTAPEWKSIAAGANVTVTHTANTITIAATGGSGGTTYSLTMNNSGSGDASGTTFDGSVARTISYNTIGAEPAITTLGVSKGGTGAGTFTSGGLLVGNGTSAIGIATAAQIVAAISTTAVNNATYSLQIPVSSTTTTIVQADRGKCISLSAGITAPASVLAAGDTVSVYNNTAGNLTITQGSGLTLRLVGTATTGNRTLAQRGLATIWFLSATEAIISGGGLT